MGEHVQQRIGKVAAAAVLAVVAITACGSDDDRAATTSAAVVESAAPQTEDTDDAGAASTEAPSETDGATPATAGSDTTAAGRPGVIAVPADQPTIQAAVDAAVAGDLILISPGTYHEAVDVTTDGLTLRGLDRNTVILDGEFELDHGVRVLGAKGVAVENMTAINFTKNGFFWTGVEGYRGSYLTAYRNGDYGIYVFDSTVGQLDHSYASGSPDAGVYIGQCFPCDAVIDQVTSEYNGLGYSGTNSGGNLLIVNSIFRFNRAGVVPNSGSYELCYPERRTTIIGNAVYSNNQPDTPAIDVALLAMGNGILSAGGVANVIERNLVYDHDKSGIGLVPFLEEDPNDNPPPDDAIDRSCADSKSDPAPDPATVTGAVLWDSKQNRVVGNVLEDNRVADLLVASAGTELSGLGNCASDNTLTTTRPNAFETLAPCDGEGSGDWKDGEYDIVSWLGETHPPAQDYRTATPMYPEQTSMPDAETAPAAPAFDVPIEIDLDAITVPAKPA